MNTANLENRKRLLVISPCFPPINAADMQRVRMSLPFFKVFGYDPEVVMVDPFYNDHIRDELLVESVPSEIPIHKIKAFSKSWTSKVGLGSLALRSLFFYKSYVDNLLKRKKFDLIYFSTTQFPVCILGNYWKKKFGVPYVIDMQDPWHSDYYLNKPKEDRPPKFWFSYRLNKYLEPIAMNQVDGLISVSEAYLQTLEKRYPNTKFIPKETITFGAFELDMGLSLRKKTPEGVLHKDKINITYIGRGGKDMLPALELLFEAFVLGLKSNFSYFSKFHFHLIGTSYAPKGQGIPTTTDLVKKFDISEFVTEKTDRIPFYDSLNLLKSSEILFIPGSDDPQYTASKIYPYILAEKPLLTLFNEKSSAIRILDNCRVGMNLTHQMAKDEIHKSIINFFINYTSINTSYDRNAFSRFTARSMTEKQCTLFNQVLNNIK